MSESSDEHEVDVDHHVKVYIRVFAALAVLTVATVGASYLHLPFLLGLGVALCIAIIKGSLVAAFFMHLVDEKKLIYWALLLTAVFFFVLLLMPTLWHSDVVRLP